MIEINYEDYYELIMSEETSREKIISLVSDNDFKKALLENFKDIDEDVGYLNTHELLEKILKEDPQIFMVLMNFFS